MDAGDRIRVQPVKGKSSTHYTISLEQVHLFFMRVVDPKLTEKRRQESLIILLALGNREGVEYHFHPSFQTYQIQLLKTELYCDKWFKDSTNFASICLIVLMFASSVFCLGFKISIY